MKTLKMLPILGCVLFLTTASTCHNDDDDSSKYDDDRRDHSIATQTMQQGNWRITYYYDTDSEETSRFSNYTFSFDPGNVLKASNGTNTYTGSWSITDSHSGNDDNPHSDVDFNIAFSSPSGFAELTDDWDIVSQSSTKIELIDVSGGNGGTDHLVFEKN